MTEEQKEETVTKKLAAVESLVHLHRCRTVIIAAILSLFVVSLVGIFGFIGTAIGICIFIMFFSWHLFKVATEINRLEAKYGFAKPKPQIDMKTFLYGKQ